ncbi:ribosomal protein S18 acetylase RimI-like enzyme [Paenibacillus phyllosphaerae]|uniref:Ribosomal protein S18 acetylase RimI-like enzyme n=1 Tax=Paenibacillus phyllosphaerae TaxID=274593 RepID=A0A7W5FP98_9BACL|nr:GNAT family N-acetyltransferase [Paenibacillus phyllosphaerae]MBB3112002.1 ribosomal protein S18 acetylase RimI-like enzyme [Paenibacillus phyllosphaerae]
MQLVRMDHPDEELLFGMYAAVYRRSFEQWGLGERETNQILQLQYRAKSMSYRNQYPQAIDFLIDLDNEAAGIAIVHEGTTLLSLIDLMVLPHFQRLGLGTQVIRLLQSEAQQRDIPVKLHVDVSNTNAYNWYVRMGFEEVSSTLTHHEMIWNPNGDSLGP